MKKRKKQSFMRRISRNMLCVILVSNLVAYCFAYIFLYQTNYTDALSSGRNMLNANLQVVNQYFTQIDQIADAIIYNEALNDVLKAETDASTDMQVLKSVEQIYFHSRNDLRLIFYKESAPRNAYSIYAGDYYDTIANFKTSAWYKQLMNSGEKKLLLTNIHAEEGAVSNDFVHSMIYRIDDLYSDRPIGYLRIDMDLAKLQQQLMLQLTDIEGIEILSANGKLLFLTGQELSLPDGILDNCMNTTDMVETSTKHAFICCGRSTVSGWIVAISISKAEFYREAITIGFLFLTTLFLSLAICLTITDHSSAILNKNMNRLTDGMNAIQQGDLAVQVDPDADDEVERVIIQFNKMVKQINELLAKVEAKQALLDEAQIKALQQQINPHFIYNSLETLMGMASEGMDREIIEICKCISAMLRYNTKMTDSSTIREELAQVQNYMRVLEMRMGGSFHTQYSIDPDCLDAHIVKFSLQPLVENAVSHGLANTAQGGLVFVGVQKADSGIEIRIRDNGCGFSPVKLKALQEQLSLENDYYLNVMENSSNTGLLNVHLRLKLHFNEDYRISVQSAIGEGTDIRIHIPCWKEEASCTES